MRTTQPIVKETDMVTKYSILPGLDKKYRKLLDCSRFSLCFAKIGYFPGFPRVLQKLAIFQVFQVQYEPCIRACTSALNISQNIAKYFV